MFNKSLFKQSCKANGLMWTVITVAVCFMLACVMLIAGDGNISKTKHAIQDTIIEGELTSQVEKRAINYYNLSGDALMTFDKSFADNVSEFANGQEGEALLQAKIAEAMVQGMNQADAVKYAMSVVIEEGSRRSYPLAIEDLTTYTNELIASLGYTEGTPKAEEIRGCIFMTLNPMVSDGVYMFDDFYTSLGEEAPRYDLASLVTQTQEERNLYVNDYANDNSVIFLAGNLIKEENVNMVLEELASFGVTKEKYEEFGFNDYGFIKDLGTLALVNFRANYAYRIENIKEGETPESIKAELTKELTNSLLASLPEDVSLALEEIGQMDLYGTLVGSIYFKMAGLLLPIIYLIMVSNSLIAGQVDSGSMAYVLSSSVKRRTVVFTQATFLVTSLFAMMSCTTITSMICLAIVNVSSGLTFGKLALINLGAFLVLFAMSGISFLASCWFNRSKRSMAIGGGINMFFLVATMLGLFGTNIMPTIIRMEALDIFNYASIISLFDVTTILDGGLSFIWKFAILIGIGVACYAIGSEKFVRKDLPL